MKKANSIILMTVLALTMSAALSASAAESSSPAGVININTATVSELSYLPGIGTSKAEAIVKYREKKEFKKVEDLMRVKGIGRNTLKKLRSYLTVNGPTTVKGKIAKAK
jgi:competence protein ComEA